MHFINFLLSDSDSEQGKTHGVQNQCSMSGFLVFYKIKQNCQVNFLFLCSHSNFYTEHWAVPAMWQNCRRVNFFLRAFLLLGIRSQTLKQSVRTLFGFTFGFPPGSPPIKYPISKIKNPSSPKSHKTSPYRYDISYHNQTLPRPPNFTRFIPSSPSTYCTCPVSPAPPAPAPAFSRVLVLALIFLSN